jgi:predicted nucleic acid-binding Zn ribbon protein
VGYDVATWSGGFQNLRGPGGWNAPPTEKLCSSCQRWLPLEQFRPNPRLRHGLNSRCKACQLERTRRWRAEHPEAEQQYNAERRLRYRAEHPRPAKRCVVCGVTFVRKPDAIVCSAECRRARQREQRRERHKRAAASSISESPQS